MKIQRSDIEKIVLDSAQRVVGEIPGNAGFEVSPDLDVFHSPMDSMAVLAFLTDVEQEVESKYGNRIPLASEEMLRSKTRPLARLDRISLYIFEQLQEGAPA